MNLKKFALFVLVCSLVYVFGSHVTLAAANTVKEDDQKITATASPEAAASAVPVELSEPTEKQVEATAAPKVTATDKSSTQKDSSKKDNSKKDNSKKDSSKKDNSKKDNSKKDNSKKDNSKKDISKKDISKKDISKKNASKKTAKKSYTKSDLRLMASIINCEAGGECFQGKLAVGIVIMNRVKSKAFPNTVKGVIYQKNQFTPTRNGILNRKLKQYDSGKTKSAQWKSCIRAAKKTLSGHNTIIKLGKVKSMKGIYFFSVGLPNAKFKLGGHRFK